MSKNKEERKLTPEDLEEFGLKPSPPTPPVLEAKAESPKTHNNTGYEGDYVDIEELPEEVKTLAFESPAELIAFFDEAVNSGEITLHEWQLDVSDELACISGRTKGQKPSSKDPLRYTLCAANGSGKDAYVVAAFAVWFIVTKIKARVIITSSSGTQLTAQTETYIAQLAEKMNTFYGEKIFKIRQRYIKCLLNGSEIRLFATDEAGRAEGYHPLEPNAEMAIIVNEAKTVHEEIFQALTRCTGYNYWLEVSSPGEPKGHFYRAFTKGKITRRVTAFDCPHLGQSYIEDCRMQWGEHSALYRSMVLALFTSQESQVVISQETVDKVLNNPPTHQYTHWQKRVGIDLAAGGDENSIQIWHGNKRIAHLEFIEKDTTIAAEFIDSWLQSKGILKSSNTIFADDGGVGRGIIDQLVRLGWTINRVLNQGVALDKKSFGNRGAEGWFRVNRLLEENLIILDSTDEKLVTQLTNRHYKQSSSGRLLLESKAEEKANNFHSPDRADAMVLAFTGLSIEDFVKDNQAPQNLKKRFVVTSEELVQMMQNARFAGLELQQASGVSADSYTDFQDEMQAYKKAKRKRCNGSLDCAMN